MLYDWFKLLSGEQNRINVEPLNSTNSTAAGTNWRVLAMHQTATFSVYYPQTNRIQSQGMYEFSHGGNKQHPSSCYLRNAYFCVRSLA